MDTSKEYIKMCDYPQIQERWKPAVGDWMVTEYSGEALVPSPAIKEFIPSQGDIWLPLQWQSQEMMKADAYRLDFKYNKYTLTLYPYKYDGQFVFTSPTAEQALLRGWFYWRYGKRWSGEKWI